ncbi:MAG: TolC family protein, partial [Deltaproteobacteria bacterium]|nr:TolC family protein [Deltaproteobacteria bacterium]
MRKGFFTSRLHVAVLACLLLLYPVVSDAGEALTLDQAFHTALTESPLVARSRQDVEAASQGRRAARGKRLPRIDLYARAVRLSDPQVVIPIKSFNMKTPPAFSRDQYGAGVTFRLPLYEGGRLKRAVTVAEFSREISKSGLRLTTQDLLADVTNIFNRILYLKGLTAAEEETLTALKKAREDAALKLKVGRIAPVDLMRIETQVAEQEQALIQSREDQRRSQQTLALLLGWKPSREPEAVGTLAPPAPGSVPTEDEIAKTLIEKRPDIQMAIGKVRKAAATVEMIRGLHLPSVDLVTDYGKKTGSGGQGGEEVWSGGVVVNLNLFSGGTISAQAAQAEARLSAAEEELRQAKLKARTEILHALSGMREARHRFEVAASARKTAEETYRIEDLRYRKGDGTVTDSLLAQGAWLSARANELAALFDMQKAVVDYRLAAGTIDEGL